MLMFGLAVALSLAPGAYAYLTSRKLLARTDDPLLPDLLLARSQSVGRAVGIAIGVSLPLIPRYSPLVIVGAILATVVGSFPARKTIFGESWGLFGYFGHTLRFWCAMLLSLVFVMTIPVAMQLGGITLGLVFGALALLCSIFLSRLFPVILRATAMARPELEEPFAAILEKARCPRPRLYEASAPGGTFVNAFALPSLWTPGVLFTSGLLGGLDTREATAIFAHEIAHLEHHDRRHLLRALASMLVLVALPVFLFGGPYAELTLRYTWIWPLVVITAFAFRARAHRSHETKSDLRGAELCGDPEALISGLTKLHTLMRVPRRWSEQHESWSTHPSLSRRIQAIRRAYAKDAAPFEPVTFFAVDASRRAAVLDAERLHLLGGIDAVANGDPLAVAAERRSLAYAELRDVRLEPTRSELVVVERSGLTTRFRVSDDDARRLSELLDRVDVRLDYRVAPAGASLGGRTAGLLVALLALSTLTSMAVAVLGILAAAMPSAGSLAAVGVGGLLASVFAWLRLGSGVRDVAFLAVASTVCLGLAWGRYRRKDDEQALRGAWLTALVPAGLALLGIAWGLTQLPSPLPAMTLHLWARSAVGTVAAFGALGAALLTARQRRVRLWSIPAGLLGTLVILLGSLAFGQRFGGDTFASFPPPVVERGTTIEVLRSVALTEAIVDLTLSPGGRHFMGRVDDGESYEEPTGPGSYLVETARGLETIEALAADFVDDETLAVVASREDTKVLVLPGRSLALPPLTGLGLIVDPASAQWRIRGFDPETYDTMVLRGNLDADSFETLRFFMPEEDASVVDAVSSDGWAVGYDYVYPEHSPVLLASGLGGLSGRSMATEVSVRRHDGSPVPVGLSLLYPSCYETGSRERFLCVASYAEHTNLLTLEPSRPAVEPLVSVAGAHYLDEPIRRGRFALTRWRESPLLVDLESQSFVRVPDFGVPWEIVAWRGRTLANATRNEDGTSSVTLYRLEPERVVN